MVSCVAVIMSRRLSQAHAKSGCLRGLTQKPARNSRRDPRGRAPRGSTGSFGRNTYGTAHTSITTIAMR